MVYAQGISSKLAVTNCGGVGGQRPLEAGADPTYAAVRISLLVCSLFGAAEMKMKSESRRLISSPQATVRLAVA